MEILYRRKAFPSTEGVELAFLRDICLNVQLDSVEASGSIWTVYGIAGQRWGSVVQVSYKNWLGAKLKKEEDSTGTNLLLYLVGQNFSQRDVLGQLSSWECGGKEPNLLEDGLSDIYGQNYVAHLQLPARNGFSGLRSSRKSWPKFLF